MPTYEYECSACGKRLDHFQSMSDAPLKKCPKCGKLRLKRLISAGAGVIFKGSGFYTTDYRSSAYNESKKGDVAAPEPAKSDSKSESKPDSKSETPAKPAAPAKKSKGTKK